jgi:DNA-binding HxlR family transcriptional regulator
VLSGLQAKLVITELRTRMRSRQLDDEVPTVSSVLVAGMRELAGAGVVGRVRVSSYELLPVVIGMGAAVLEDEDINEAISTPEMGSWEGVIEVLRTVLTAFLLTLAAILY